MGEIGTIECWFVLEVCNEIQIIKGWDTENQTFVLKWAKVHI